MFEIEFRVDYLDTDAMGIVHHSRYLRYFERARVRWLEAMGIDYATMDRAGEHFPLTGLALEYLKPLRFDDRAFVSVGVKEMGRARVTLAYEIISAEGRTVMTRATTEHVLLRGGRPVRLPEEWRNKWPQPNAQKS